MTRRSLRPQLNQIRGWVRQGRTDAWIAHQLEVTVQQIQSFKRENELEADGESNATGEEVDLRAEDDAALARMKGKMTVINLSGDEKSKWDGVFKQVRARLSQGTFSPDLISKLEGLAK